MGKYNLFLKPSAKKELANLQNKDCRRIAERISLLANDPRPNGCEKMAGQHGCFRIRQGDYRIIYSVDDLELKVRVLKIGHRREVCR